MKALLSQLLAECVAGVKCKNKSKHGKTTTYLGFAILLSCIYLGITQMKLNIKATLCFKLWTWMENFEKLTSIWWTHFFWQVHWPLWNEMFILSELKNAHRGAAVWLATYHHDVKTFQWTRQLSSWFHPRWHRAMRDICCKTIKGVAEKYCCCKAAFILGSWNMSPLIFPPVIHWCDHLLMNLVKQPTENSHQPFSEGLLVISTYF